MKRALILNLIVLFFIALFGYAAFSKLATYQVFETQLAQSPFITGFASVIVWALPATELLVAATLMAGILKTTYLYIGMFGSLFLMAMFTSYIAMMLGFSFYIPCSCGGILSKMSWTTHLFFNIFSTTLAIVALLLVPLVPQPVRSK
ncbi:MauE/DoxX family redox-associated membrane protein [Dinghuibacter silviterrae]|nr:MauE/DoxX family redox-associated membrane protein [Dinghuibacter silviterrae]